MVLGVKTCEKPKMGNKRNRIIFGYMILDFDLCREYLLYKILK
jgi:hypothetical protein